MSLVATLLGLSVLASACGSDGDDSAVGNGSTDLSGRTFLSQSITEHGEPRDLVDGTMLRIEFRPGEIGVHAGCNQLFGTIESSDGGRLTVSAMGGTAMGCDPERHDQDAWIAAFIESGPTWSLDGDTLVLASDTTEITLLDRVVADPDRPLEATRWVLDTLLSGEMASSLPVDRDVELIFNEGTLSVAGGCNEMTTTYRLDGEVAHIDQFITTDMACEPVELMMLDDAVSQLGGQSVDVTIVAGRLTLVGGDGQGLGLHAD